MKKTVRHVVIFALVAAALVGAAEAYWYPRSMLYLLQADARYSTKAAAVASLAASGRDLLVLDYAYGATKWTASEISAIRSAKPGRQVVAYLSIGEAENYRFYWKSAWDANKDGKPDAGAPSWLMGQNPDWPGNYRVRYWERNWQTIIFSYVNEIRRQGFDGVYLDIVDGFEGFEQNGNDSIDYRINPVTGKSYRQDMVSFVASIAFLGRLSNPYFRIIPQNGSQLLAFSGYRKIVSGIGVEDLFNDGDTVQPASHTSYVLSYLRLLQAENKAVFVIEYSQIQSLRLRAIQLANQCRLLLLLTDRDLTTLGTSYVPSVWP